MTQPTQDPMAALQSQLSELTSKVSRLVGAYEALAGSSADESLKSAASDATAAAQVAQQAGQSYATCQQSISQLTQFLQLIYQQLGVQLSAQPQDVLNAIAALQTQAKQAAAQPQQKPGQPPAGYVPLPMAAGLALGALAAGGLGGWYAKGKFGGEEKMKEIAKENPLPEGPCMTSGRAYRQSNGKWEEVLVSASVVRVAKFVRYHEDEDGERLAIFKTPTAVYAQEAKEEAPKQRKRRTPELPARTG